MIEHPLAYLELLQQEARESIREAALRILAEVGMRFDSAEARALLAEAGAQPGSEERLCFSPEMVEARLANAPARWTLHARNPQRSVEVGVRRLLVSPGYGSAFVCDTEGNRRPATLADLDRFARLAAASDVVDITGGLLVEPTDVPLELRPLQITHSLIVNSDKPFFGSVDGAAGARESLQMARIVCPELERTPAVVALVNINSPLRLDARMADALIEYARAGQPVLLTPGILMGVTAPVTAAGALAQAWAELLACVVLTQVVRPGAPVIIGLGGFAADLRDCGPGFGRPENALATVIGAQLARDLGLPFRCSAAVTGARTPDCRSGYERMMTAMAGWAAGAHLALQALGTLDSINSMCFEQFVVDCEIWRYLSRLSRATPVDAEALALDVIASAGGNYLGAEHTVAGMRRELYEPSLAPAQSYDTWALGGREDVLARAKQVLVDSEAESSEMDSGLARELESYVASRRRAIGA